MNILIYNSSHADADAILDQQLNSISGCSLIFTKNHEHFRREFTTCFSGETLVVFFIYQEPDMAFIESLQAGFVDIKLIINLSGNNDSIQSRALKLHPRIITDFDENPDLLTGVIQGIVKEKLKHS